MRYLGDIKSREFHDLTRQTSQCQIAVLQAAGQGRSFVPDTVVQAIREGYAPCPQCLATLAELPGDESAPLAAAADLRGEDLGDGLVSLRWTHPGDLATQGILFDVYSSPASLEPFRTQRVAQHPSTSVTLSGFSEGGDVYFTVVARRGGYQSLPSAILRLFVKPVQVPIALAAAAQDTRAPAGLGFPFRIDGAGRVSAQGGDPLLRGRILQLLLTSPGERVNLPEYGTRLRDLVFDPNNDVLAAATEFTVTRALRRFLGDEIHVDKVQVNSNDNELSVDIVYLRKSDLSTERLRVGIPISR